MNVNVNSNFMITLSNISNNRVVVWIKNSHRVCVAFFVLERVSLWVVIFPDGILQVKFVLGFSHRPREG